MTENEQPDVARVETESVSNGETTAPESPTSASDVGPPFEPKSFGGAFVWAQAPGYTATVLRIREGENVAVSTQGRTDMVVMLTGGRGIMEIRHGTETERLELQPAAPFGIEPDKTYRLLAMTEVELFTVFTTAN